MSEEAEQTRPAASALAACGLALAVLLSTTTILIHDVVVALPVLRAPGLWTPQPDPTLLTFIAPADSGIREEESPTGERHPERRESPLNAYRSAHWATATAWAFAVPLLALKVLAVFGLRNLF